MDIALRVRICSAVDLISEGRAETESDIRQELPFSSKELRECYRQGQSDLQTAIFEPRSRCARKIIRSVGAWQHKAFGRRLKKSERQSYFEH